MSWPVAHGRYFCPGRRPLPASADCEQPGRYTAEHLLIYAQVKDAEARRGGLDVSLFRMLSEAHPAAVVDLSHQYRMNEDIMLLSNHLIYENRLQCGSEEVRHQALSLPSPKVCQDIWPGGETSCNGEACWLQDLMSEK